MKNPPKIASSEYFVILGTFIVFVLADVVILFLLVVAIVIAAVVMVDDALILSVVVVVFAAASVAFVAFVVVRLDNVYSLS